MHPKNIRAKKNPNHKTSPPPPPSFNNSQTRAGLKWIMSLDFFTLFNDGLSFQHRIATPSNSIIKYIVFLQRILFEVCVFS